MGKNYDFSGWATKNDRKCSDGRTIKKDAFKDCDGKTVPIVWGHMHDDPEKVLGHGVLKNEEEGVRIYGSFNSTPAGIQSKALVEHGDITSLSIYANQLKQRGGDVIHGDIKEVSLVLAPANPGALIDYPVLRHGDDGDVEEMIMYSYDTIELGDISHADGDDGLKAELKDKKPEENKEEEKMADKPEEKKVSEKDPETIEDVINTMNDIQKKVLYYLVGMAAEQKDGEAKHSEEDYDDMKKNVFEGTDNNQQTTLSHSDMQMLFSKAERAGSLKRAVIDSMQDGTLSHSAEYGIENMDLLFPEARNLNPTPAFIDRDTSWVNIVMSGVHKLPFAKVRSTFADITEDEARAKGYIKGRFKKNEVFKLLKRVTGPTTVYKKQKFDKDDLTDASIDTVAWVKGEMRGKLNEELARAYLIGDGRLETSEDKIDELCIRPIYTDADLFSIKADVSMAGGTDPIKNFMDTCILARSWYKGSGSPTLFTTEAVLTRCLIMEDGFAHKLFKSEAELATALRVKNIVTVESMEGVERTVSGTAKTLLGIIVNLADYGVGTDKGGEVSLFDDFDIDYNQMKYLIETRCSGALTVPFSAIVIEGAKATYNPILSNLYFTEKRRAAIDAMLPTDDSDDSGDSNDDGNNTP